MVEGARPKSIRSDRHRRRLEVLTAARKEAGLTQAEVAQQLSRPQSYLAKAENGERRLDVVEFIALAEAIGTDPQALLAHLLALPGSS